MDTLSQRYCQPNRRQTEDFDAGGLPSHLPSPPEHSAVAVPAAGAQPPSTPSQHAPAALPSDFYPPEMDFMSNMVMTAGEEGGFYPFPYYFPEDSTSAAPKSEDAGNTTVKGDEGEGEDEDDDDPAPLGLDETILILVPQFKYTIHGFPEWAGASVRMSLPITSN